MAVRVRPISVTIHVEAVADDGVTLVPLQIEPVKLTASQFEHFSLVDEMAQIEESLIKQAESSEKPTDTLK